MTLPTAGPELVLMTLADARLPSGGHTQSAGLEAAVRAGLGAAGGLDDVAGYARDRLRTVVRVDAGTAVVARHLTLAADDPLRAEAAWAARTPSAALRTASRRQGRGYLRLAARVWPRVLDHLPADAEVARPVVLGVLATVTGLSAEQAARLVGYDDVQTVLAASLKLLPADPAEATARVATLHPEIERMAAGVAHLRAPEEVPATAAPLVDLYAESHATQEMRLFHA